VADVGKYRVRRAVRVSGTGHENRGGWLVESTSEQAGAREKESEEEEGGRAARLLNMHGPNGTGRGRDKGRLIFPAFHFVPSLFYFGANRYRYPRHAAHRRRPPLPLPLPLAAESRRRSASPSKFSLSLSRMVARRGRCRVLNNWRTEGEPSRSEGRRF